MSEKSGMASDDVEVLRVRCSALGDSPAEKLVRRLLWDLSAPGREPTDEAWAKVYTREVKILAAAVVSLGALREGDGPRVSISELLAHVAASRGEPTSSEARRTPPCSGRIVSHPDQPSCTKLAGHDGPCLYGREPSAPASYQNSDSAGTLPERLRAAVMGDIGQAPRTLPDLLAEAAEAADRDARRARNENVEARESLPLRLRHAAAGTGGYGPSDLAALLEEAAQVIAAQPGVATEGEPMHSINMSPLDLEAAIQEWVGERYGFLEGWWKATVKLPDEHSCVVAWQLEDEPLDKDDELVGDKGEVPRANTGTAR